MPRLALPAIHRWSLVVAPLAIVLVACSGGGDGGGPTAAPGDVTISADNLEFDTDTLTAPVGEAFTIGFTNADTAPHNVSIYNDESRSETLFQGEVIGGGQTITYEVNALEAGEYYFICDLHPEMDGTLTVE